MNRELKIGDNVRITEDINLFNKIFKKGHKFKIYGSSYRGWDLIDDDGNKIDECLFIHDKLELCSIKEERLQKLKKINFKYF